MGGFTDLTGSNLRVGGIRTVVDPDSDMQKVYVPQWSVTNGSKLDDGRVCREMVDEFAPPKFFALVRGMEHDQLFTEFNVGAACQMSLSAKVRMRAEYNIREKKKLKSIVEEKDTLLKAKDTEIESLRAQLLVKEAEAAEAIRLRAEEKGELAVKVSGLAASVKVREQEVADLDAQVTASKSRSDDLAGRVHDLEVSSAGLQEKVVAYEDVIDQIEKFQDERMAVINEKFNKLDTDFIKTCLHLEEKFYPHLLTTIVGRRWLLTHGVKLAVFKCHNSPEYLSALGAAINRAIEKGMQEGLAAGITHGREGRVLSDVAAFNPSVESDFSSALQDVQNVNFSLFTELMANKDASVEAVISLLRLDEALADRLGLGELQPHVDQLMVPVHHSPDQTVIGARALSFSLDVSHSRVQRIRDNIANSRSALRDVFVSFSEPLSSAALEGTEDALDIMPIPAVTTTALSATFASSAVVRPISTDDYEILHADGQEGGHTEDQIVDGNADSFLNVDDTDLSLQ
ncbi:hypothetical protein Tco_0583368 [Tanacetum coccineum]